MQELCERVKARGDDIISFWEDGARKEPWLLLPETNRTDHLPQVVQALADAVLCGEPTREKVLALARAAARHGQDRVGQGLPDSVIMTEYYLLRQAIWEVIRTADRDPALCVTAIYRVDTAISLATRASMLGYHKAQLATRGDWESVLEAAVDASPLRWRETGEKIGGDRLAQWKSSE